MNRTTASRSMLLCAALAAASTIAGAQTPSLANATASLNDIYRDTLKGSSTLTDPPMLPEKHLGLLPAEPKDDSREPVKCGTGYSDAPMVVGPRDQYAKLGGLVKGAGMGLLAKALSSATGGAVQMDGKGKEEPQPALYEDPIKKKFRTRVKDKASGTKLSMGGTMASDGIVLSTRLDSAEDKGTFHEVYLERDDCRRVYPFAEYTYELWGKWQLTVSWTKTTSTYQNGKLLDRQTSSGGFTRSGTTLLDAASGSLPLSDTLAKVPPQLRGAISKYQAQLRDESGPPMWQRLGFGAPTSGARTVGTLFKLSDADLAAIRDGHMKAVVQVTRERGPLYEAVGVPVALSPGKETHLAFAPVAGEAQPDED
jgi:hypothetical protein